MSSTIQEIYEHMHKLNQMKLKPSLGAYHTIRPGKGLGLI